MKYVPKFRAWDKEKIKTRQGTTGIYKQNGYVYAKAPYHPFCNSRGYVREHRLVYENSIGRYLTRDEIIHHIDGNRSNNELSNLELTTYKEHYIKEHFTGRKEDGTFMNNEPVFDDIKYRLYDREKQVTEIYTLRKLIYTSYNRAKFEYRGMSTGLRDKNGKEIYEGDILEIKGHPFQRHTGEMSGMPVGIDIDGRYVIEYNQENAGYVVGIWKTREVINYCTVIGNIHEYPELLEEYGE